MGSGEGNHNGGGCSHNDPQKAHQAHESHHQGKKRKHEQDDRSHTGLASTLALLREPDLPKFNLSTARQPSLEHDPARSEVSSSQERRNSDGRPVKKPKKIPKQESKNYPSIVLSSSSRLQSQIKISDLQGLLLYILADGPAPQWISVKHRPEIRKLVVLMVPGLEKHDFNEPQSPVQVGESVKGASSEKDKDQKDTASPDFYFPTKLSSDKLPSHVKKFADMFDHLWPVKTPGDDRFGKMHSPLHAMLSAPIPKSQEEKDIKGAKNAREPQGWRNKRTRISQFISSAEELLENDYTIHPAMYEDENEKRQLEEQRQFLGTSTSHGWVDTTVSTFESGSPPEAEIEHGSLTAGREVIAMDCEMCKTGEQEFSLTRISLVSWDGTVVLDELVKPENPIIDYLTM